MRKSNKKETISQRSSNRKLNDGKEAEVIAEQSVLGSLLLIGILDESKYLYDVGMLVSEIDERYFYYRPHKLIFQTIRFLVNKCQPVDMLTVCDILDHHGQLEDVGGYAYLADLCKNLPSAANVKAYISILREAADRRDFNIILQNHLADPAENVLQDIGNTLSELERMRSSSLDLRSGLRPSKELVDEWEEMFDARLKGELPPPLQTGIENLDEILAPLYIPTGSLVVIGARPKMGKTQFILKLAEHIGLNLKRGVASFTLEMTCQQLIERMLGMRSCVSYDLFYHTEQEVSELEHDEYSTYIERIKRVKAAMNDYRNANYYISDDTNSSIEVIEAECRQLNRTHPLSGIFVDYLTLMPKVKAERNDLAFGEITRRLKQLAKELDCVVFLVTQLNRQLEQRLDKRPLPSDSRDTGQIEQDCDLWLGLYRDAYYHTESEYPDDVIEVIVRLNRHGDTGTALCRMIKGNITNYTGAPIKPKPKPFGGFPHKGGHDNDRKQ